MVVFGFDSEELAHKKLNSVSLGLTKVKNKFTIFRVKNWSKVMNKKIGEVDFVTNAAVTRDAYEVYKRFKCVIFEKSDDLVQAVFNRKLK